MGRPFTHPWRASITSSQNQPQTYKTVTVYNSDCRDPICTTNLLRLQHQLRISMSRIYYLENRMQLFTGGGGSTGGSGGSSIASGGGGGGGGGTGRKSNSCWPTGVGAVEGGIIQHQRWVWKCGESINFLAIFNFFGIFKFVGNFMKFFVIQERLECNGEIPRSLVSSIFTGEKMI